VGEIIIIVVACSVDRAENAVNNRNGTSSAFPSQVITAANLLAAAYL
jgi:hypothetical protein